MTDKKGTPCGGCLERNLPAAERKLNGRSPEKLAAEVARTPLTPNQVVLAVVMNIEANDMLIGKATGQRYGRVRNGVALVVAIPDLLADTRLARATADTLGVWAK